MSEALDKFYPVRYQESATQEEKDLLELSLAEKWRGLAGKSVTDCVRILLTCTRKWQFFGATLFEVQVIMLVIRNILKYIRLQIQSTKRFVFLPIMVAQVSRFVNNI